MISRDDLAPLSWDECDRRGIKHSSLDFGVADLMEFPAVEFRRKMLSAAAERVGVCARRKLC